MNIFLGHVCTNRFFRISILHWRKSVIFHFVIHARIDSSIRLRITIFEKGKAIDWILRRTSTKKALIWRHEIMICSCVIYRPWISDLNWCRQVLSLWYDGLYATQCLLKCVTYVIFERLDYGRLWYDKWLEFLILING